MKRILTMITLCFILTVSVQAQVTKESLNLTVNPITQITGKLGNALQDTDLFVDALIDTFRLYGRKQDILSDLFTNSRVSIISQASGNTVVLAIVFNSFDYNLIQKSANPDHLDYIDVRLPGYLKLAVNRYAAELEQVSGARGITFNTGFSVERDGSVCQFNMERSFDSWVIGSITFLSGQNQIPIKGRPYNQYYFIDPMTNPNTGQMNASALLYALFSKASKQYTASEHF
jgi:hypothetical protein